MHLNFSPKIQLFKLFLPLLDSTTHLNAHLIIVYFAMPLCPPGSHTNNWGPWNLQLVFTFFIFMGQSVRKLLRPLAICLKSWHTCKTFMYIVLLRYLNYYYLDNCDLMHAIVNTSAVWIYGFCIFKKFIIASLILELLKRNTFSIFIKHMTLLLTPRTT